MIHFWSSEQRARSSAFEQLTTDTDGLLRNHVIAQGLGSIGIELLEYNEAAFLPNVFHGRISIPRSRIKEDGTAILPILDATDQARMTLHESIALPTPRRKNLMLHTMQERGENNPVAAYSALIKEKQKILLSQATLDDFRGIAGSSTNVYHSLPPDTYQSRPLTIIQMSEAGYNTPALRGALGTHELIHARDYESVKKIGPYFVPHTELRAYTGVNGVMDRCQTLGLVAPHERAAVNAAGDEVIAPLLAKYGIDAYNLLNGDFTFTEQYDNLAFEMWFNGIA